MEIRCVKCHRLVCVAEEGTEIIGAIKIKCSRCNLMNVISGVLRKVEEFIDSPNT